MSWCLSPPAPFADVLDDARLAARARFAIALEAAHAAGRGVPDALELEVRAFARAARVAGTNVSELLIDLKAMIRDSVGVDEVLFTPKIVGWAVAGYYAGSSRSAPADTN